MHSAAGRKGTTPFQRDLAIVFVGAPAPGRGAFTGRGRLGGNRRLGSLGVLGGSRLLGPEGLGILGRLLRLESLSVLGSRRLLRLESLGVLRCSRLLGPESLGILGSRRLLGPDRGVGAGLLRHLGVIGTGLLCGRRRHPHLRLLSLILTGQGLPCLLGTDRLTAPFILLVQGPGIHRTAATDHQDTHQQPGQHRAAVFAGFGCGGDAALNGGQQGKSEAKRS